MTSTERRLWEFATGALAALTDEQVAECQLLALMEPGLRLRNCEHDPGQAELLWAGAVIGCASWAWLCGEGT
jgi:hypothetical protein